jgi:hypothetical protein
MALEKFDFDSLTKERIKSMAKTIRVISMEDLKKIGDELFKFADDPWRQNFYDFIKENPGSTCHHAVTGDGVNLVYCRDKDIGLWFLPGRGMGPLQTRGRQAMKELVEAGR